MKRNFDFLLLQLLFILASVHSYRRYNLQDISEVLRSGMDNITKPCDDFYQHACGDWFIENELPSMTETWDVNVMSEATAITVIRDILESPNIDESNRELLIEKQFYDACMDKDYSRKEGAKLLEKILTEIPKTSWQDVAEYYATFNAIDLFHIKLSCDNFLSISRPYFSESNKKPSDLMSDVISGVFWLYNNVDVASYFEDSSNNDPISETMDFIVDVNKITFHGEKNVQTVAIVKLQELYDNHCPSNEAKINWLQFFQRLAAGSGTNFTEYDQIKVDVQYLKDLCELLSVTPEHAIVNYLNYNFVFNKEILHYIQTGEDEPTYTERYIGCIQNLKITDGFSKEMLKSYITPESKKLVKEMYNNIKWAMINEMENSWLEGEEKEVALKKARELIFVYSMSNPFEKKFGQSVTYEFKIGPVGLQNEFNLQRAQIVNILKIYRKANQLNRKKRSVETNACYCFIENVISIGLGLMFPPYFDQNAPLGFNYGRLGSTIGHEISHAFDFTRINDLLKCTASNRQEELGSILKERGTCFMEQFDNLEVDGLRTLDENVADTQGLKLALKAMNKHLEKVPEMKKGLPDFESWSQEKLFFLSFANKYCSNPEYKKDDGIDEHSPHMIRVLGTLKNMNEFARTFECTEPKILNPKCDLWLKS